MRLKADGHCERESEDEGQDDDGDDDADDEHRKQDTESNRVRIPPGPARCSFTAAVDNIVNLDGTRMEPTILVGSYPTGPHHFRLRCVSNPQYS